MVLSLSYVSKLCPFLYLIQTTLLSFWHNYTNLYFYVDNPFYVDIHLYVYKAV